MPASRAADQANACNHAMVLHCDYLVVSKPYDVARPPVSGAPVIVENESGTVFKIRSDIARILTRSASFRERQPRPTARPREVTEPTGQPKSPLWLRVAPRQNLLCSRQTARASREAHVRRIAPHRTRDIHRP